MIDKYIYKILDWITTFQLSKDSPLRDGMFWWIVTASIIYLGVLFWGITRG